MSAKWPLLLLATVFVEWTLCKNRHLAENCFSSLRIECAATVQQKKWSGCWRVSVEQTPVITYKRIAQFGIFEINVFQHAKQHSLNARFQKQFNGKNAAVQYGKQQFKLHNNQLEKSTQGYKQNIQLLIVSLHQTRAVQNTSTFSQYSVPTNTQKKVTEKPMTSVCLLWLKCCRCTCVRRSNWSVDASLLHIAFVDALPTERLLLASRSTARTGSAPVRIAKQTTAHDRCQVAKHTNACVHKVVWTAANWFVHQDDSNRKKQKVKRCKFFSIVTVFFNCEISTFTSDLHRIGP